MIKSINIRTAILIVAVIVIGAITMWWIAIKTDKDMRSALLKQARITAKALDFEHVSSLSGSKEDLNLLQYRRLKEQLCLMRRATRECRFLYLMGRHADGSVFFFVDSLPANSKDYAPPGMVYEEVPDSYLRIFNSKKEYVVGPITDRWGTLVTALIPISSPRTGNLVTVLGMDINASDWNGKVIKQTLFPFAIILLLMGLLIALVAREKAVISLRRREEEYSGIFNSATDAFLIYNFEGIIADANPRACEMYGYSREELTGLAGKEIVHPDYYHFFEKFKKDVLESGEFHAESVDIRKNKDEFNVEIKGGKIHYRGKPHMLAVAREITKRKQAEKALRKSEEKLRTIIEHSNELFYIHDTKHNLTYMSPNYKEILGYTPDEMMIKWPELATDNPINSKGIQITEKAIKTGEKQNPYLLEMQKKDGTSLFFEIDESPVKNTIGEVVEISGAARDITKRVLSEKNITQLRKQLVRAQKMEAIGTLAGGIAHDFNNILFGIFGYLEMALNDIPENNPAHSHLEKVFSGAERAGDLVKQILTFSRQTEQELKPLKTQVVIKEALKLIKSSLPSTIKISQYIRKDCGLVLADRTQIHQVIMNLCTNAYHAMAETGGKLKVTLKEVTLTAENLKDPVMAPGPHVCLTVADTGPGMDPAIIARIFDPYFTTKEEGKGTGLGLAVVQGIVRNHGGHISVYSELGTGTEFRVYLPIIEKQSVPDKITADSPIQKGTERILLVDDEEMLADMEKEMLERLGYRVTARTSSTDALSLFQTQPDKFDLVITDMTMPNMTGDKLAAELIKVRPDIPIILCTGFSELMSKEKAASLGIKGFLMKPIVMKDLSGMIREMI